MQHPSNNIIYFRIGRTGRKNNVGTAYTFMTEKNAKSASMMIQILTEAKQVTLFGLWIETDIEGLVVFSQ